ncbi:MAG TPA: PH domain-containing protein [Prosthecobacter sp.]
MNTASPLPASPAETSLWKGHTSQWVHFWYYFFCLLLVAACLAGTVFTAGLSAIGLIVPFLMWVIRWWATKCTSYELTSQRLKITSGILNRKLDELELFRVKDYAMDQPLALRILGLGNLTLMTSDATTPTVAIQAIPQVEQVRETLRTAVQAERDRKRVRELDVDGTGADSALV